MYIKQDYTDDKSKGRFSCFDRELNLLSAIKSGYCPIRYEVKEPRNFDKMVKEAKNISSILLQVRVTLNNIDGKIYFDEMMFYPSNGYTNFVLENFDYDLRKKFEK